MTELTPHARRTARLLFEINAVLFNADKPFIFTSGRASPVYVDCRRIPSFVRTRRAIMEMGAQMLLDQAGAEAFDVVAGGETAGIPYAAFLAEQMDLPMIYVRKQPKGHGRNAQIEGELREGQRVLLVEDLATDGGSKVRFCQALRDAGAIVEHIFVVFHYGIFAKSQQTMDELGVRLHALATWWDMLAVAREDKRFDLATLDAVESFLRDPITWSRAHGGKED
ncbi:MAG: orotate phosphoribosyltransferase [Alphaproteobacteria bacterium]|nr:MAG: orotate phosphoribosyltransferase [Alphaproteobacteria bacterium]